MIIFLLAITCIMLCCSYFIKDENLNNNLFFFFSLIPIIMYFNICLLFIGSGLPNFRPGDPQWRPIWLVICLMFVSLSGVLFAYLRSVNPGIPDLTFIRACRETFLVMNTFGFFIFFLGTFVNPTVNKQISDIDTEEKKAEGTRLVNKVNLRNYASMTDTKALIENIVIYV